MEKKKKSNEYLNDTVYGTLSSFDTIKLLIEQEHYMGYDTIEDCEEGEIKFNEVLLPKSNVVSYHLYKISDTRVSMVLNHLNESVKDEESDIVADSIDKFLKRSSLYIHHLLKDKPVDMITYHQSPVDFNEEIVDYIIDRFGKTPEIKRIPNLFIKDFKSMYVNTDTAKELGLSNYEIHMLMEDVERWKEDAEMIKYQTEADELKDYISSASGKRGRPTRDISTKKELVKALEQYISIMKELRKGKGKTSGRNREVKSFDIDSIEERKRRSIEGLYNINLNLKEIRLDLKGKHIVVFDDHISSGATLDEICLELKRYGVASILPITLAVIPKIPMPRLS